MSPSVYPIIEMLCTLVSSVPVGTKLGLVHLFWALLSGQVLAQRGAVVPALAAMGLSPAAVRRAWRALAHGCWQTVDLLAALQRQVQAEGRWQAVRHGGYAAVVCDLTAFFRPTLRGCATRHYSSSAKRMLAALPFGLLVRVGQVGTQRIPLPVALVRADPQQREETALMRQLLAQAATTLQADEVLVADRGFGVALVQQAGVKRFVVRVQRNAVAYRRQLPAYGGQGRKRKWGDLVRPLGGLRKGVKLPATPPDRQLCWQEPQGSGWLVIEAQLWDDLTVKGAPAGAAAVRLVAIYDPRFSAALLLATDLPPSVDARALRDLYVARWPVEQVPQTAKQLLGTQRQFVFGAEARWRWPELSLTAACVALYLAATQPPVATGFWDRRPRTTPGRLRRWLATQPFPHLALVEAGLRKKASVTAHLAKGIAAHRRQPSGHKRPNQLHKRRSSPQVTRN